MARRIDTLDVARGTAMLFVCLSHFASVYLAPWDNPSASPLLRWSGRVAIVLSMVASPTFVIVSGIVVGYLYRLDPAGMPSLRRKLIDRGLFLLLIGHLIQVPAYSAPGKWGEGLRFSFITDAIAVAIIVGPTLIERVTATTRLFLGALAISLCWGVDAFWLPHNPLGKAILQYVFGGSVDGAFTGFAVLPWLGVYLMGTCLGERLGNCALATVSGTLEATLRRVALTGMAVGGAITVVRHAMRAFTPELLLPHPRLVLFLTLSEKFPPGPIYLLFFGGAGLLLVLSTFALARNRRLPAVTRSLATIGRASFFIFIVQAYVYYIVLPAMKVPYPQLWPLYYVMTILLFVGAASVWNRYDANRYLSVGLWRTGPLVRSIRARIQTAPAVR